MKLPIFGVHYPFIEPLTFFQGVSSTLKPLTSVKNMFSRHNLPCCMWNSGKSMENTCLKFSGADMYYQRAGWSWSKCVPPPETRTHTPRPCFRHPGRMTRPQRAGRMFSTTQSSQTRSLSFLLKCGTSCMPAHIPPRGRKCHASNLNVWTCVLHVFTLLHHRGSCYSGHVDPEVPLIVKMLNH